MRLFSNEIVMGVSFSIPPYVISESSSGVEIEIINEVFSAVNIEVKIYYLPLGRTFIEFEKGTIDGIINVREDTVPNAFVTEKVITFNNCAISLKKHRYPETFPVSFLFDKNIIAFQRAPDLLKQGLDKVEARNPHYTETSTQLTQVLRLYLERSADFIILEESIFRYYQEEARDVIGDQVDQEVTIHRIFDPIDYRFAFNKESIRDEFNRGLNIIKKNGLYDEIFKNYGVTRFDEK